MARPASRRLSTFLAGTVATFTVVPAPTLLGWRSTQYAGYIEDTVKLTPRLELRAGFRFEGTNGWNESQGRAANYAFTNGVIATNPTIGSSALAVNNAKFLPEPRIGLAWDPQGNGHTAVRGGFGIHRALLDNLDYRLDQTAPFNTTVSVKNIAVSSPALYDDEHASRGKPSLAVECAARYPDPHGALLVLQGRAAGCTQHLADRRLTSALTAITRSSPKTRTSRFP